MEARWRHLAGSPAFLEQNSNFNAAVRKAAATHACITVAVTKPSSPHCVETSAADQELAAVLVTVAC